MTKKEKTVEIPIEGSLGILAHGDIGLLSWRKKRDLEKKAKQNLSKVARVCPICEQDKISSRHDV